MYVTPIVYSYMSVYIYEISILHSYTCKFIFYSSHIDIYVSIFRDLFIFIAPHMSGIEEKLRIQNSVRDSKDLFLNVQNLVEDS